MSYGSDWEGINRDVPSKADEIIDWGVVKKLMKGNGFERWVFWWITVESC